MKTQIFISYRRDGGETMAQILHDKLKERGYQVFYDIESLKSGQFDEKLLEKIEECQDMILVLSARALDRCFNEGDWVRREIGHALQQKKNIVPIIMRGFAFPNNLPADIVDVVMLNGVMFETMEYFEARLEKLTSLLKSVPFAAQEDTGPSRRELVLPDGGLYVGEAIADKPHGQGKCYYRNGSSYVGHWEFGEHSGQGEKHYENGDHYVGNFSVGKRQGHGVLHYQNGNCYEGDFANDKIHGSGTMTLASGGSWIGEFKDGAPYTGQGKYAYKYGTVYDGELFQNMRHGHGIFVDVNGDRYEGQFVNNLRQGQGTLTWAKGGSWTGEFHDNRPYTGVGKYPQTDGSVYDGELFEGQYHRQGDCLYPNGDRYKGEYSHDKRHGQGQLTYADGGSWNGEFKDNEPFTGSGKRKYYNCEFVGNIAEGKQQGYGVCMWEDGTRYEGEFKNGLPHGHGRRTQPDGKVEEGKFVKGNFKKHGKGGCYIATAVYGSYDCPAVWTLRRYRDDTLAKTILGRAFIRIYYAISPTLVKWFGKTRWFQSLWKRFLDRKIEKLNQNGVENTPYQDRPWQ